MYHLPVIDPAIDQILNYYDTVVLSRYWPKRFHLLADRFQTLPFPYEELEAPKFNNESRLGSLSTYRLSG